MKNNTLTPALMKSIDRSITLALSIVFIFFSASSLGDSNVNNPSCTLNGNENLQQRVISVGGANTEILYALGLGECIAAIDTSSTYPQQTDKKPKVGYMRTLSAEPILAIRPTLIVLDEGAGPHEAIMQLNKFDIPMLRLPAIRNFEDLHSAINEIGEKTNRHKQSNQLNQKIIHEITSLNRYLEKNRSDKVDSSQTTLPRIAFLMNLEPSEALLAGSHTSADSMIQLAGGQNAVTHFTGYKTVTAEALAKLNPDIIITTYRAVESLDIAPSILNKDIVQSIAALPALKLTSAARQKRIYLFDTQYLLGFGPRSAVAALALAKLIYPQ